MKYLNFVAMAMLVLGGCDAKSLGYKVDVMSAAADAKCATHNMTWSTVHIRTVGEGRVGIVQCYNKKTGETAFETVPAIK